MKIGGLQKLSLIDFPDKVSSVIFTQGCNFRCPFCHNPELVLPEQFGPVLDEKEVFAFLEKRKGKIEGVVVTGGEPTIHTDILFFLMRLKDMGFAVKLDTNGSRPMVLEQVIRSKLVDFIAMDIKAPLERYHELAGVPVDGELISESIYRIISSGIAHEFRTTVVPLFLTNEDIGLMADMTNGAQAYRLQDFINQGKLIDPSLEKEAFSD